MPNTTHDTAQQLARRGRVRRDVVGLSIAEIARRMDNRDAAGLLHDGAGWDAARIGVEMSTSARQIRLDVARARLAAVQADCKPCSRHLDGLMTFAAEAIDHSMTCAECKATRQALRQGKAVLKDRWQDDASSEAHRSTRDESARNRSSRGGSATHRDAPPRRSDRLTPPRRSGAAETTASPGRTEPGPSRLTEPGPSRLTEPGHTASPHNERDRTASRLSERRHTQPDPSEPARTDHGLPRPAQADHTGQGEPNTWQADLDGSHTPTGTGRSATPEQPIPYDDPSRRPSSGGREFGTPAYTAAPSKTVHPTTPLPTTRRPVSLPDRTPGQTHLAAAKAAAEAARRPSRPSTPPARVARVARPRRGASGGRPAGSRGTDSRTSTGPDSSVGSPSGGASPDGRASGPGPSAVSAPLGNDRRPLPQATTDAGTPRQRWRLKRKSQSASSARPAGDAPTPRPATPRKPPARLRWRTTAAAQPDPATPGPPHTRPDAPPSATHEGPGRFRRGLVLVLAMATAGLTRIPRAVGLAVGTVALVSVAAASAWSPTPEPRLTTAAQDPVVDAPTPLPVEVVVPAIPPPIPVIQHMVMAPLVTPTARPTPTPTPPPPPPPPPVPTLATWEDLAFCESTNDWTTDTGNGFYGGLQFTLDSWRLVGGTGYPHQHSKDEQIRRAERLLDIQGWEAWPVCSRRMGLR